MVENMFKNPDIWQHHHIVGGLDQEPTKQNYLGKALPKLQNTRVTTETKTKTFEVKR